MHRRQAFNAITEAANHSCKGFCVHMRLVILAGMTSIASEADSLELNNIHNGAALQGMTAFLCSKIAGWISVRPLILSYRLIVYYIIGRIEKRRESESIKRKEEDYFFGADNSCHKQSDLLVTLICLISS